MSEQTPLTDLSYLKNLTGGATDKMSKYIRMFLTGAPISLQQLDLYCMSKDWSGVRQTAHALKPQLGYFGAKGAEEIAKQIERMAADQTDLDRLPLQIENFKSQVDRMIAELESTLKDLGS